MADRTHLSPELSKLVYIDGPWLRCRRCPTADPKRAYWGGFRDDAVILAKYTKHADKAHKAAGEQPAAAARPAKGPKAAKRNPQSAIVPAPKTVDVNMCAHNVSLDLDCPDCLVLASLAAANEPAADALIEQAMRDLQNDLLDIEVEA